MEINTKTLEEMGDDISKTNQSAVHEALANITLFAIAFKSGRVSDDFRMDFLKAAILLFRDQLAATGAITLGTALKAAGGPMSIDQKRVIMTIIDAMGEEAEKSQKNLNKLYRLLYDEHQEEINNERHRLSKTK